MWITSVQQTEGVFGFRLSFKTAHPERLVLHVSADERFELYLDGQLLDTGPGPADRVAWAFVTLEAEVPAGHHHLAARVWRLGDRAPYSQMSAHRLGFILQSEGVSPPLHTGHAPWVVAPLAGIRFSESDSTRAAGWNSHFDGSAYPSGWEVGEARAQFGPPVVLERGRSAQDANEYSLSTRLLVPTRLPAQQRSSRGLGTVRAATFLDRDAVAGDHLLSALVDLIESGNDTVVPPGVAVELICDLEDYICAYTRLTAEGGEGARIGVWWQESLYEHDGQKGNRDIVAGKVFPDGERSSAPAGHTFIAGGGPCSFSTLWWNAGRYIRFVVDTTGASHPTRIAALTLLATRYPYDSRAGVEPSDPDLAWVVEVCTRTLHNCSHESMMDCPYYEQLQYVGDSRMQALLAYATTDDDRLARAAIEAFDRSRSLPSGLTASRYPSRVRQEIPGFSLWWVAMVYDFALWRGDEVFVRSMLPGVRAVLDVFYAHLDGEGLLRPPNGWQFVDWVDDWAQGVPPGAQAGQPYAHLQFQYALALAMGAQVEEWMGEPHLAEMHTERRRHVLSAAERFFWDDQRGVYADDVAHSAFSEHAQALAVLAGAAHGSKGLARVLTDDQAAKASHYFAFYVIEALGVVGDHRQIRAQLQRWTALRPTGLLTTPEEPEPSRSDCHAWSAHPIVHLATTAVGVKPAAPGWSKIRISDPVRGIGELRVSIPTPRGVLHADFVGGSAAYRWQNGDHLSSDDLINLSSSTSQPRRRVQ
ncbi:hypothetical protein [Herbiconiux sp. A18JL235]|uniref:Alpha-L-rhamnosidase six-hairpin glycosidase domain-containing protein n=1 Tax=Herbiconiux sp. A18JL235 TaxID=3152363 RepID=A0AB39BHI6_9MICO